jgi:hypothetical protein
MARHSGEGTWHPRVNWVLLLLGLCVVFWIIVTTEVTESF